MKRLYCPACNDIMLTSNFRKGRQYCPHANGKYVYNIYDDGAVRVYQNDTNFFFELKSHRGELTEEYIDKLLILK
jgi:hypothetical protein